MANVQDFLDYIKKPFVITIVLTITLIKTAINITLLILAPAIMIIIGPKATLGNEFKQVKKELNPFTINYSGNGDTIKKISPIFNKFINFRIS